MALTQASNAIAVELEDGGTTVLAGEGTFTNAVTFAPDGTIFTFSETSTGVDFNVVAWGQGSRLFDNIAGGKRAKRGHFVG